MSARTCQICGSTLDNSATHCPVCGEEAKPPQPVAPAPSPAATVPNSAPERNTGGTLKWIGLGAAAAVAVVGGGVVFAAQHASKPSSNVVTTPSAATPSTTPASAPPSTPAPEPSTGPTLATTPYEAMQLTAGQARRQLEINREDDRTALPQVRYSWVPQVSSKCEGLDNVDIKPSWFPNGVPDTNNLSPQQILAFHLSLANDEGALLVTDRDVGDRTVVSACNGRTMWMAIIPKSFGSADGAKAWCDRHGFPLGECAARWVVKPGTSGAKVEWRT